MNNDHLAILDQGVQVWNKWREQHPDVRPNPANADLRNRNVQECNLCRANLDGADLRNARLEYADLRGTTLLNAKLQGTKFQAAIVDGETLIWTSFTDEETDFTGVGLDSARVAPGVKQLLQKNVRRLLWEKWYKQHSWPYRSFVRWFWSLSDYGISTGRVIAWFFVLVLGFAILYYVVGQASTGVVARLFEDKNGQDICGLQANFRAVYFSVVTMTTLGFGDMYAAPHSVPGYILLMIHVLLGYVLLAALVTRFAILFAAAGPAEKKARALILMRVSDGVSLENSCGVPPPSPSD